MCFHVTCNLSRNDHKDDDVRRKDEVKINLGDERCKVGKQEDKINQRRRMSYFFEKWVHILPCRIKYC